MGTNGAVARAKGSVTYTYGEKIFTIEYLIWENVTQRKLSALYGFTEARVYISA